MENEPSRSHHMVDRHVAIAYSKGKELYRFVVPKRSSNISKHRHHHMHFITTQWIHINITFIYTLNMFNRIIIMRASAQTFSLQLVTATPIHISSMFPSFAYILYFFLYIWPSGALNMCLQIYFCISAYQKTWRVNAASAFCIVVCFFLVDCWHVRVAAAGGL